MPQIIVYILVHNNDYEQLSRNNNSTLFEQYVVVLSKSAKEKNNSYNQMINYHLHYDLYVEHYIKITTE